MALADPNRLRGDLDQFVGGDPLDGRLEGVRSMRSELDRLVDVDGADVGELLGPGGVGGKLSGLASSRR